MVSAAANGLLALGLVVLLGAKKYQAPPPLAKSSKRAGIANNLDGKPEPPPGVGAVTTCGSGASRSGWLAVAITGGATVGGKSARANGCPIVTGGVGVMTGGCGVIVGRAPYSMTVA